MERLLATKLDQWKSENAVHINESASALIVAGLTPDQAKEIFNDCSLLAWHCAGTDGSESPVNANDVSEAISPVRLEITKPTYEAHVTSCLTLEGFKDIVRNFPADASEVRLATLESTFQTWRTSFINWHEDSPAYEQVETKPVDELVRCYGNSDQLSENIGQWLLSSPEVFNPNSDALSQYWTEFSIKHLLNSIASEINYEKGWITFIGPPRYKADLPPKGANLLDTLTPEGFIILQKAVTWVYQDPHSSEQRHTYLAAEIARSSSENFSLLENLKQKLEHSLESAKIAYRLGLSEVSSTTLSALSELRKSVAEETSKVSENTKQLSAYIIGAIASSIALIILRLKTTTDAELIMGIMASIVVYILWVSVSGWKHIGIQKSLREEWQDRLYRFLTAQEYEKLVTLPLKKSEKYYAITAILSSVIAVILGSMVMALVISEGATTAINLQTEQTKIERMAPKPQHNKK